MEAEEQIDPNQGTPEELKQISSNISILPEISKQDYEKTFTKYKLFLEKYNRSPEQTTYNVLLSYVSILSNLDYSASTLRKTFSILKTTLLEKHSLSLDFQKIERYIAKKEKTHLQKQSSVFTQQEISFFLQNADDSKFLIHKLITLISIYGTLRCNEITNLTWDNIVEQGDKLLILILESKTKKKRR